MPPTDDFEPFKPEDAAYSCDNADAQVHRVQPGKMEQIAQERGIENQAEKDLGSAPHPP